MSKKEQPQFKMRMENGETESLYAEEHRDLKLEKLTQKVTLISILIPVLIGVIFFISYMDIKSRVSTVKDTGESGVQSLSQNLESRFSSLSLKFAALEEAFTTYTDKAIKTQQLFDKKVKESEKSIRWLNKIKAGKKAFDQQQAAVETNLKAIRTDLQILDENLSSLDQSVKKELADLVALVETSGTAVLGVQAQITEKIDREEAGKLIGKQKQELLESLEAMGLRLEKQIVLNRQKIAAVQQKTAGKTKATPKKTALPKPAEKPVPKKTVKPPEPDSPAPKPGEIVEQDL